MLIPRKTISVALSCTALVCGFAFAHGIDRGENRSSDDGTRHERASRAVATPVFPSAGGDSAEPERSGLGRYGDYARAPHDDRWTPNPRVGAPLPSAGGDSAETDQTDSQRRMGRDHSNASVYDDGMRHHRSATRGEYAPSYSYPMSRRDRTARSDRDPPRIGDPFPTAGGDSAQSE